MSFRIKISMLYVIGSLLVAMGLMVFFVGLGMACDHTDPKSKDGLPIAIASFALTVPGSLALLAARGVSRQRDIIEAVASITKSYRRITIVDMADKLHTTIPLAQKALNRALALGLVSGHFDRTTDEFFTREAAAQKADSRFCASCGAPLDRVYLSGETIKCAKCGAVF